MTGYSRARFGTAWKDVDRNGCDTRNDVLRRDLTLTTLTADGCAVVTGSLTDPYSRTVITFRRGRTTSTKVQIDHVVALGDAWAKGAQRVTVGRRTAFANDPLNLLATSGTLNAKKGSGDAATWLPPKKAFRCTYIARQIAVKRTYKLSVTKPERDAMARILKRCTKEVLPRATEVTPPIITSPTPFPTQSPSPTTSAEPSPSPTTTLTPTPTATTTTPSSPTASPTPTPTFGGIDPRFSTCAAAKAAGYGPYRQGIDPEYDWYRDADHDGTVCE
jgi:uncharacterized protein DUF1524/excalibur calcium-binding domain-containing protein